MLNQLQATLKPAAMQILLPKTLQIYGSHLIALASHMFHTKSICQIQEKLAQALCKLKI
jgi:hypothetical protein